MLYHRIDSQWISLHFVGNCTVLICKWISLPVFLELHCTVLHSNVKSAFHLCKRREWATGCSSHAQITATRLYCTELQLFELDNTELHLFELDNTELHCIALSCTAFGLHCIELDSLTRSNYCPWILSVLCGSLPSFPCRWYLRKMVFRSVFLVAEKAIFFLRAYSTQFGICVLSQY